MNPVHLTLCISVRACFVDIGEKFKLTDIDCMVKTPVPQDNWWYMAMSMHRVRYTCGSIV